MVWFFYTLLISRRAVEHLIWLCWPVGSHLVLNKRRILRVIRLHLIHLVRR